MYQFLTEKFIEYWPFVVSWLLGTCLAFSTVWSFRLMLRDCKLRDPSYGILRMMTWVIAGGGTYYAATTFYNIDQQVAIAHGIFCGGCYSLVARGLLSVLKRYAPEMYEQLRVPRRRCSDKYSDHDPDDTGNFRL